MALFKPRTTFDKAFEVGILLKGLDGVAETLGGLLLLFVKPDNIDRLVKFLTQTDLNTNPHNFIARHMLHWAGQLTEKSLIFGAIYLLIHGLAKIILVIEILRNHLWAYVGLIVITVAFIIYQAYEVVFSHSITLGLLIIFDAVIVYLTVKEYKKQRQLHADSTGKE